MKILLIPSALFLLVIYEVQARPSLTESQNESDNDSIIAQQLIESNQEDVISEAEDQKTEDGALASSLEDTQVISSEDTPVSAVDESIDSSPEDAQLASSEEAPVEAVEDESAIADTQLAKAVDVSHLQDPVIEKDIQALLQDPSIQSWLQSSDPVVKSSDQELIRLPRDDATGYGALTDALSRGYGSHNKGGGYGSSGGYGGHGGHGGGGGYGNHGHGGGFRGGYNNHHHHGNNMMGGGIMPVGVPIGVGGMGMGGLGGLGGIGLGGLGVGGLGGLGGLGMRGIGGLGVGGLGVRLGGLGGLGGLGMGGLVVRGIGGLGGLGVGGLGVGGLGVGGLGMGGIGNPLLRGLG